MAASWVLSAKDWHAFITRYRLSTEGVAIESKGRVVFLEWERFEKAVYSRLFGYIRLTAPELTHPVVLMLGAPGAPGVRPLDKMGAARDLVQEALQGRYRERWP
jgi:hypothetical protein